MIPVVRYLVRKSDSAPMVVMVLDEIDQLETRDKSVLYKVFVMLDLELGFGRCCSAVIHA